MVIKIHTHGFSLSMALNQHTNAKLRLALSRYEYKIRRVEVMLKDLSGPKGNREMSCKIKLKVDGLSDIVISESAVNMYEAINNCAHRLKRSAFSRLDRAQRRNKLRLRDRLEQVPYGISPVQSHERH